jgi:hypothetical protein
VRRHSVTHFGYHYRDGSAIPKRVYPDLVRAQVGGSTSTPVS